MIVRFGANKTGRLVVFRRRLRAKIHDKGWEEMSPEEQKACAALGWTNEKMWDEHEEVAVSELGWGELSKAQQKSAVVLGYTQETWDADGARDVRDLVIWAEIAWEYDSDEAPDDIDSDDIDGLYAYSDDSDYSDYSDDSDDD